ncbi:hypothetical protein H8356DRAFT_999919 [Neocallimastix lanati (nom. inval.)]|nr:hypothetical protein H8356DRAFT_999919 [Neocallimastix sp. JGI-2020a]
MTRVNSTISPALNTFNNSGSFTKVNSNIEDPLLENINVDNISSIITPLTQITPITPVTHNSPYSSSFINGYNISSTNNTEIANTQVINYDTTTNNIFHKSYRDASSEKDSELSAYFENINFSNKMNENDGLSHAVFGDITSTHNLPKLSKSYKQNSSNINENTYKDLLSDNYKNEIEAVAEEISLTESEKVNLQSTFKELEDYQRSRLEHQTQIKSVESKPSLDDLLKTDFKKFVNGEYDQESNTKTVFNKYVDGEQDQRSNVKSNFNKTVYGELIRERNVSETLPDKEGKEKSVTDTKVESTTHSETITESDNKTNEELEFSSKSTVKKSENKENLELIKVEIPLKANSIDGINNSSESPSSTFMTGISTPTTAMRTNISTGWNHAVLRSSPSSNLTGFSNPITIQPSIPTLYSGVALNSRNPYIPSGLFTSSTKTNLHKPSPSLLQSLQPLPILHYDLGPSRPQEVQQESFSISTQLGSGSSELEIKNDSAHDLMPFSSFGVQNKETEIKDPINIISNDAASQGNEAKEDKIKKIPEVNPFQTFGDGRKVLRPDENEGYRGQMILTEIKDELNFSSFNSSFSSFTDQKSNSLNREQKNKKRKEEEKKKKEEEKKKKRMEEKKKKEEMKKKKEEEKKRKKEEEKHLQEEKKRKKEEKKHKKRKNSKEQFNEHQILNQNNRKISLSSFNNNKKKRSYISLKEMATSDDKKNYILPFNNPSSVVKVNDISVLSKSDSNINRFAFLEDYFTNLNDNAKNSTPVIVSPPVSPNSISGHSKDKNEVAKMVNQRKSLLASLPSPSHQTSEFNFSLSPGKRFIKRSSLLPLENPEGDIDMTNPETIPYRYSSISTRTRPIHKNSDEEIPVRLSSVSPKTRPISRTSTSIRISISSTNSNFNLPTSLSLVEGGILAPDSPSLLKEMHCSVTTEVNNEAISLHSKSSFSNSYRSFSTELDQNILKQKKYNQQNKKISGRNDSLSTSTTNKNRKEIDSESVDSYESFSSEIKESLKRQKHRSRQHIHNSPNTEAVEALPYGNINTINSVSDLLYIKEYNSEKNNVDKVDIKVNRFSSSSYNPNLPSHRKYGENRLSYYSVRPANRNSTSQFSTTTADTNDNNSDFENFVETLMNTKHHQKYDHDSDSDIDDIFNTKHKHISTHTRSNSNSHSHSHHHTRSSKDKNHSDNELISDSLNQKGSTSFSKIKAKTGASISLRINTSPLNNVENIRSSSPSSPFTPRSTSLINKKTREKLEIMGKIALGMEIAKENELKETASMLTQSSRSSNQEDYSDNNDSDHEESIYIIPPKPSLQSIKYTSKHRRNSSTSSQSSISSTGSLGSRGSRGSRSSCDSMGSRGSRGSKKSSDSQSSHSTRHSAKLSPHNPRTSILKVGSTFSDGNDSPLSGKRVSISERPKRIEYSYSRNRPVSISSGLGVSPTYEKRLNHLSEYNEFPRIKSQSLPRPGTVEYTNIYPKRSSIITNVEMNSGIFPNSSSSNYHSFGSSRLMESSRTGSSSNSSKRNSLASSLNHHHMHDYYYKRSSLSTTTLTSSSSLSRPKKIDYYSSNLSSSGTSSLNRPIKIEYLKKSKRNSTGIFPSSSSYTTTSSQAITHSKSSHENYDERVKRIRHGGMDSSSSSPTKDTKGYYTLERIKEDEILDNSADDSYLLQCSLTSTSIDRLNSSFSKENFNQSFSFSSLSGVADYPKSSNIKAMIERSKSFIPKETNSITTTITSSSVVPPSGIIIGPDDLRERKIFSLSGNSSGYTTSQSSLSRFNQTISFASISSIPDTAINRNVNRVSCLNLGFSSSSNSNYNSNSSSTSSSAIDGHHHTLSTHVFISDFDSITSMSTGFKSHIKNVMNPMAMTSSPPMINSNSSSSNSNHVPSSLKNLDDSSSGKDEESIDNSSFSIMKPYIPGFENNQRTLSLNSSRISSSIYNFVNKETLENQRQFLKNKKSNNESNDDPANTSSTNVLNTSDILPPYNIAHSSKVNNFRKSDIFAFNKDNLKKMKYTSYATSNGYINYLSEGDNSFNNYSLISNYSTEDELINEISQTSTQAAEVNPSNFDSSIGSLSVPPQFGTLKSSIQPISHSTSILTNDPNISNSMIKKITFDDSCDLSKNSNKAIKFKSSTESLPSLTSQDTKSDTVKPTRIKELARQRMSMFNEINSILDRLCISNFSYDIDQRALPSIKFNQINNFTHSLGSSNNSSSLDIPYQPVMLPSYEKSDESSSLYQLMTTHHPVVPLPDSKKEENKNNERSNNNNTNVNVNNLNTKNKNNKENNKENNGEVSKIVKPKKSRGLISFGKGFKMIKNIFTGSNNNNNKKKKMPMRVRSSSIYMDNEGRGVEYSIEKIVFTDEDENAETNNIHSKE